MTFKKELVPLMPRENDILEKLDEGGYFKAIDQAKLSKRKFLETLINLQEDERKKLGHELHDSVNSSLTIAKFYLGLLPADSKKEKYAKEQLSFIISTTEQCIRSISSELVVFQEIESGLLELVSGLVDRINSLKIFNITFKHSEKLKLEQIPSCQKIVLYRIIQEQLNNTIKYSKASKVSIHIALVKKFVKLTIKDNGVGFDMATKGNGIGLSNISNRAKQFNGNAHIQSKPGKGCQVDVSMPVLE
ncbi:MAG: sensor histidine kinase [Ferruginibacter sp.]